MQSMTKMGVPIEIQNELEEVKRRLKEIFNYYSSFGDRLNLMNLKSMKFHKMLLDAGILTEQANLMEKKRFDLIFCQVNKHKPNMVFDTFLQVLTKVADYKFPQEANAGQSL